MKPEVPFTYTGSAFAWTYVNEGGAEGGSKTRILHENGSDYRIEGVCYCKSLKWVEYLGTQTARCTVSPPSIMEPWRVGCGA